MAMQFRAPTLHALHALHPASRSVQTRAATKTRSGLGGGGDDDREREHKQNAWNIQSRDRCPVFQWMAPVKNAITPLEDVRDIYEICQEVKHRGNRESIYIVNNLFMEGVETYLHTVQYFERCLRKPAYKPLTHPKKKKQM